MSAMFYLNRGGAPEGPFEEARLVYMIHSGELSQAAVCPVGHNQWLPLHAVPAFAQALAARAAHVAPAAAYGPPGAAPAQAAAQPAQKKKSLLGWIAALAVLFLALIVAGGFAAYSLFLSSGGARAIASSVPRDSEFLIEIASIHQLAADLHDVRYLDTSLRDDKQVFADAADSVAKSFDISVPEAVTLLASCETFGMAGRKLARSPEVLLALGMKNASPVETLLKSARFSASGTLGNTGKRYQLTRQADAGAARDLAGKGLAEFEVKAGAKEILVWFPKLRVLAMGSEPLLLDMAHVLESGAPSIQQNPSFQAAAKDFEPSTRLTAFVDPASFANIADPKLKTLVDDYFKPAGPITGQLRIKPAGFVTSFTGRVQGSKLPHAGDPPQTLSLGERLPEETFAYLAFSTSTKLTGAETEKLLLDQLSAVDQRSRTQLQQALRELEQLLGVSASKLLDGASGPSVIGLSAPAGTSLDALGTGPQALSHFNLSGLLELKDATEYKKLAAELKRKVLPNMREISVSDDGSGFTITPRMPLPVSLRVKFLDKYLFLSAGGNSLCDRAEAAFSKGERTLKDDAAHQASLTTVASKQHFLLWIDSGRLVDTLGKNPLLRAQMTQSGISLDKFKLTGPDRIVSALSMSGELENGVWTFHLDALNFQALAPLGTGAALAMVGSGMRLPAL